MRVAEELRAYEAAGSLAEELPYWGWLDDGRTCLTRSGELIAAGRLRPAAVDGRTPEQIDRVLGLWQRLLSGLGPGTRFHFYLLRRPEPAVRPEEHGGSDIASVSKRERRLFLARRVQRLDAYVVWSHDPGLRPVADGSRSGPVARLTGLWKRRRGKGAPTYLASEIEAAAGRFRAMIEAGRSLVAEHTPVEMLGAAEASRLLSELTNRPGTAWDGATGSGMNWRLAVSELEAERSHLTLDGEPVILYSLLSPPGQAHANLLRDLYCLDATLTVSLEWRPWTVEAARRRIRGAQRHYFSRRYSMMAHVQETEGTAAAMVDSAAAVESDRLGGALVELEGGRRGLRRGRADGGAPRRLGRDRAPGRRRAAALRGARREGGPGGLRPAARLVRAAPGPAAGAAGANGVRLGRARRVPRAGVRAARGLGPEPAPRPRGARGPRDPVAHRVSLRSVRGRRGPHADPRRDGLRQEFRLEFSSGRGAQVRPPRADPGPGRLLPLADPASSAAPTSSSRPATRSPGSGFSRSRCPQARAPSSS